MMSGKKFKDVAPGHLMRGAASSVRVIGPRIMNEFERREAADTIKANEQQKETQQKGSGRGKNARE